MVSLRPLITKMKPVVVSIHLGFFLSCLQMTDSPLCDPEGCTIQQWSESAKTVLSCFKRADRAFFRNTSASKSKMLTLLNARATGKGVLPCDKKLVVHTSVRIVIFVSYVICKLLRSLAGSRYFQVHLNIWKPDIVCHRVGSQIKWKYLVMVWQ